MLKVKSLGPPIMVTGRGMEYPCHSPIVAPRDGCTPFYGPIIEIDGVQYPVRGINRFLPNRPIRVGELIGIVVGDPC